MLLKESGWLLGSTHIPDCGVQMRGAAQVTLAQGSLTGTSMVKPLHSESQPESGRREIAVERAA